MTAEARIRSGCAIEITASRLTALGLYAAGLVRALGEANAIVVGHGLGGLVAWTLAAYNPKVVRRLAVISMAHPLRMRASVITDLFGQGRRNGYAFASQLPVWPERRLLKDDVQRIGLAGALSGVAAFVACLVLVLLSIALAFGLVALGIWAWAAFLIVSGVYVLFAALVLGIAYLRVRRLSGLNKTRKTVTEGLELLRHEDQPPDGQRPEITTRTTG